MTDEDKIVVAAQQAIASAPKGAVVALILKTYQGRKFQVTFREVGGGEFDVEVAHWGPDGEPTEADHQKIAALIDRIAGDAVPLRNLTTDRMRAAGGGRG